MKFVLSISRRLRNPRNASIIFSSGSHQRDRRSADISEHRLHHLRHVFEFDLLVINLWRRAECKILHQQENRSCRGPCSTLTACADAAESARAAGFARIQRGHLQQMAQLVDETAGPSSRARSGSANTVRRRLFPEDALVRGNGISSSVAWQARDRSERPSEFRPTAPAVAPQVRGGAGIDKFKVVIFTAVSPNRTALA